MPRRLRAPLGRPFGLPLCPGLNGFRFLSFFSVPAVTDFPRVSASSRDRYPRHGGFLRALVSARIMPAMSPGPNTCVVRSRRRPAKLLASRSRPVSTSLSLAGHTNFSTAITSLCAVYRDQAALVAHQDVVMGAAKVRASLLKASSRLSGAAKDCPFSTPRLHRALVASARKAC